MDDEFAHHATMAEKERTDNPGQSEAKIGGEDVFACGRLSVLRFMTVRSKIGHYVKRISSHYTVS